MMKKFLTKTKECDIIKLERELNIMNTCTRDGFDFSGDFIGLDAFQLISEPCVKEKLADNLVPVNIYVNEEERAVTVVWADKTVKVVCDNDDTFSVDAAFAQALKYKLFGTKTGYKKKWWNIISKKIVWLGNVNTAETAELTRQAELMLKRKEKVDKRAALKLEKKKEEARKLLGITNENIPNRVAKK